MEKKRKKGEGKKYPLGEGKGIKALMWKEVEVKEKLANKNSDKYGKREREQSKIESKKTKFVRFYGRLRTRKKVKEIKPLIVGRRLKVDSWKLCEEAVWKLSERGVLIAESK